MHVLLSLPYCLTLKAFHTQLYAPPTILIPYTLSICLFMCPSVYVSLCLSVCVCLYVFMYYVYMYVVFIVINVCKLLHVRRPTSSPRAVWNPCKINKALN